MGKRKVARLDREDGKFRGWIVWCPACDGIHVYDERWDFNGDIEKPTFHPGHVATSTVSKDLCHSVLEDGELKYFEDCSHQLAGKSVQLEAKFDEP